MFGYNNSNTAAGANLAAASDGSDMSSGNSSMIQGIGGRRATRLGGMFHAMLLNVDNDTVRTVITFANRAVADEWWRAISTSNNPLLLNNTQRITPYLYSFRDSYQWYLTNFFTEPQLKSIADDFKGKMFFQPASAPDGSSVDIIIPTPPIVDHVSGDWFSVQSKVDNTFYWCCDGRSSEQGCLEQCRYANRTLFKVYAPDMHEGAIMIDDDDIIIVAQHHGFVTFQSVDGQTGAHILGVTTDESKATRFKFRDLENGRFIGNNNWNILYLPHNQVSRQGWFLDW